MLTIHPAKHLQSSSEPVKIGLAIAGGGPLGAIYELGALRALDESINGLRLDRADVYVGVSAGAFLAASLANGVSTADMCRIFINTEDAEFNFKPESFLRPAYREYLSRAGKIPRLLIKGVSRMLQNPGQSSLTEIVSTLSQAIPSGLFNNQTIANFLSEVFNSPGRSNDFRQLQRRLYILAVDLDNGSAVRFGSPGLDHVPISQAVQASAALPGLYPPVKIDDRYFVDGALRRTLHGSAALNEGVDILFGVNPLVPFDSEGDETVDKEINQSLIKGGLPVILSQTMRALIQSRIKVGFEKYQQNYLNSSLLLIEPNRGDRRIFFTNIFSYSSRRRLCEHAYQLTRQQLRAHRQELDDMLAPYGMNVDESHLNETERTLTSSIASEMRSHAPVANKLYRALTDLDEWVEQQR